jgi:uncharacterized protein YqgC (DUF456 family)
MVPWLFALGVLLIILGVAGTVLPLLPGPPLAFAGFLLTAWCDGFSRVGWLTLAVLGLLTLATVAIDLLAASWGVSRLRASPQAIVGSALGSVVGLFAGLPGLIAGPFVGAVAGEYVARRDLRSAGRIGLAAWLGIIVGGAARLAIVCAMIAIFAIAFVF